MVCFSIRGWGIIIPISGNNNNNIISSNTTWYGANIYWVFDDVTIKNNATLDIEPGTNILFFANYNINLQGDTSWSRKGIYIDVTGGIINAVGLPNNKILFSAYKHSDGWSGIIFNETPNNLQSKLNYCIIEYVEKGAPSLNASTCGPGSEWDGAIYINNFDNIIIENCTIRHNSIYKRGGGIMISTADPSFIPTFGYPQISNNEIYNNSSKKGGAICVFSSDNNFTQNPITGLICTQFAYAKIENNDIYNNIAYESGGGIAILRFSTADIINNQIYSNTANCIKHFGIKPPVSGGGGIAIGQESYANINNNEIWNNSTIKNIGSITIGGAGGGILVKMGSEAEISNNNIYANSAYNGGGIAVYNSYYNDGGGASNIVLFQNLIHENIASDTGGGITIRESAIFAKRNSIYNNTSSYGGGISISSTEANDKSTFESYIAEFKNNEIYSNNAYQGAGLWVQSEFNINYNGYLKTHLNFYNNLMYNNISNIDGANAVFNSYITLNFHNNTISNNYATKPNLDMGDGIFIFENSSNNTLSFIMACSSIPVKSFIQIRFPMNLKITIL